MPFRLTRSVKFLLISCFAAFVIQQTGDQFFGTHLLTLFALVPSGFVLEHRFWQLFTYAFLHGDVMHLFLNLFILVFIGAELETLWGTSRFLKYYFTCSISAGILYLLLQIFLWGGDGLYTPMLGASGGIYGLLLAYGLIFGERVFLFMLLFPMKAKHFVWVLALVEFMTTLFSGRAGLASAAHLGGMFAGFVYLWTRATWSLLKKRRALKSSQMPEKLRETKKNPGHLKLIVDNERKLNKDAWSDSDQDPKTWH